MTPNQARFALLVLVTSSACQGARAADSMPTSHLTVIDPDQQNAKVALTGPAFAVKTPSHEAPLIIYVFDGDTSPEPSCDAVADNQRLNAYGPTLKRGGWVSVITAAVSATGKVPVKSFGMFVGYPDRHVLHMGGGEAKGVFMNVSKIDARTIGGEIVSDPASTTPASGSFLARICP